MYGGSTTFLEVSYSLETSQIFEKYDVINTPTFIVFVDGSNVSRHDGVFSSPSQMGQFVQNGSANSSNPSAIFRTTSRFCNPNLPHSWYRWFWGLEYLHPPAFFPCFRDTSDSWSEVNQAKTRRESESHRSFPLAAGLFGILLVGVLFVVLGSLFWSVIDEGKLLIALH